MLLPLFLIAQPPTNDDCIDAQELVLSNGEASAIVDLENATGDNIENCDEAGVWYSFMPDASADAYLIITLNEDGDCNNDDTEIHIFRGNDCGNLTELTDGCQDEDNTVCENHERFAFLNESTEKIYIHVARDDDDEEDDAVYRLLIQELEDPGNDDCVDATQIQFNNNGDASVKVDLSLATQDDNIEDCDEAGVWFTFSLTNTGPVTILTQSFDPGDCDEDDDTEIHVFKGNACDNLTELTTGCQDEDNTECENNEAFTFDGAPGDVIYVHVARNDTDDNLQYTLSINSPSPNVIVEELPAQNWKQLLGMMLLLISIGTVSIFRLRR